MRKKGEDEVPLAFLPMSEKRPGPFMAMAAAAATAAGGRGRGVEGEAAADRSRGERRGQTVRRRRHEVLCGARQMNDRRAGLVRVSSSWSLHCTFSAPAFPRFHRTKDLFFFLLFKEKENSAISDNKPPTRETELHIQLPQCWLLLQRALKTWKGKSNLASIHC